MNELKIRLNGYLFINWISECSRKDDCKEHENSL